MHVHVQSFIALLLFADIVLLILFHCTILCVVVVVVIVAVAAVSCDFTLAAVVSVLYCTVLFVSF